MFLRWSRAWVGAVLGLGILLSVGLFLATRGWERRESEREAAGLAGEQIERLRITVLRSMEVLHSIAALHEARGGLERVEFRQFVRRALARQPELQALSWNPVVPAADRSGRESAAVRDGLGNFTFRERTQSGGLVAEGPRSSYVPVYFIEPLEGNVAALGFDLNSDVTRREFLERARDSGEPVATTALQLAQEPGADPGLLVLLPVYRGGIPATLAERRGRLEGFAVAVFRVRTLIGDSLAELKRRGLAARLYDGAPGRDLIFSTAAGEDGPRTVTWLEVAGRRWAIELTPTPGFLATRHGGRSWLVLGVGLAFTLLTTAYVGGAFGRERAVAAANAALQEEIVVRKQAEHNAAAANAAKSDFLANMSHEIRTPLNAILGYTQLIRRDPHLAPEHRDALGGIHTSGQHLLGLINEVLDLAKIEAGRMELQPAPFDLHALLAGLASTFRLLCARQHIGFRLEVESTAPNRVVGDEGKLRQVLINLLGNAVKFTDAGEVRLRCQSQPPGWWRFEVVDTGHGIPAEEQADIFQPFHQGSGPQHQGGTGLGLAIARRQVELLGGSLELQSERGIGSCFHFTIPLEPAAGVPVAAPREVRRLAAGSTVTALVVDDRKENRDVLGGLLTGLGGTVWLAASADDAVRLARRHRPSMVFLDWLLPGANGADLARRLLAEAGPEPPRIVMHTASALMRYRDEAREAGCVDVLAKPFTTEQLADCLRRHLGVCLEEAEAEFEPVAPPPPAVVVVLPGELCARLTLAAELHSTTTLKSALQDLRELGPEARQLAEHLRHRLRSFDLDGVQEVLSRCVVPAAAERETLSSHDS